MQDNEWLINLKVGDKVIVNGGIKTIERFTKNFIILKGLLVKYRRKDGWQAGTDLWNKTELKEATQERIDSINYKIKRLKIYNKIQDYFRTTSKTEMKLEKLERIWNIINE